MLLADISFTPFRTRRAVAIVTIGSATLRLADIGPWPRTRLESSHVDSPGHVYTVCPSRATRPSVRPSLTCVVCRAAPETRQPPSYDARSKPDVSRKRKANLKPAQKAKLLVEWAQLPTDNGGWKVGVGAA